ARSRAADGFTMKPRTDEVAPKKTQSDFSASWLFVFFVASWWCLQFDSRSGKQLRISCGANPGICEEGSFDQQIEDGSDAQDRREKHQDAARKDVQIPMHVALDQRGQQREQRVVQQVKAVRNRAQQHQRLPPKHLI